jgi:hypothetical protein
MQDSCAPFELSFASAGKFASHLVRLVTRHADKCYSSGNQTVHPPAPFVQYNVGSACLHCIGLGALGNSNLSYFASPSIIG